MEERAVPGALAESLSFLQGIDSCEILEGWEWKPDVGQWALRLRMTRKAPATAHVPRSTEWFFLCEPIYPWGHITVHPAKENGLEGTFPHQNQNAPGPPEQPWRAGNVCLDASVSVLARRSGQSPEPFGEIDRLAWRVARLEEWLRRAARGELFAPGDPFELPDYSPTHVVLGFNETPATFASWQGREHLQSGTAELARGGAGWYYVSRFMAGRERTVLQADWGATLKNPDAKTVTTCAWIRLAEVPVLRPWRAPKTWGELRQACGEQGTNLDSILFPLLRHVRTSRAPLLLLGFPMPRTVGGEAERMHWQALRLNLSHKAQKGFRPTEEGFWRFDRHNGLADDKPLEWLKCQNWAPDQISTRGLLASELVSKPILLIGAGALGSALGELLVRGGATDMAVIDKDIVEAGNLVRHISDLNSVGLAKASDLANRLNSISPHAEVTGMGKAFPNLGDEEKERISRCAVIIDTTAADDVLEEMARYPWDSPKLFASVSLGRNARRLFCFAVSAPVFSHGEFRSLIGPWLSQEAIESDAAGDGPVWMGIGCWHPIFPAAVDDVRLMAGVAAKELQRLAVAKPITSALSVWEQTEDRDGFSGIRRANLEADRSAEHE